MLDGIVAVLATRLRYSEYVKEASEELYSTKLFIYLSVVLHFIHCVVFHKFYFNHITFAVLEFMRWFILLCLTICLLITTPRDLKIRPSTNFITKVSLI